MDGQDFLLAIDPRKIFGAIETEEEVNGKMEQGVFIPYKDSTKQRKRSRVIYFGLNRAKPEYRESHYVTHILEKDVYNRMLALGVINKSVICGKAYSKRSRFGYGNTYQPDK